MFMQQICASLSTGNAVFKFKWGSKINIKILEPGIYTKHENLFSLWLESKQKQEGNRERERERERQRDKEREKERERERERERENKYSSFQ